MEWPSISFNQKGSASRNKQDLVGDLPPLGRMDPHFSPLGAGQSYPEGWAQTGHPIQELNSVRPTGVDDGEALGEAPSPGQPSPARDSHSPPCPESPGRKFGWCSSICSWDTTSFQVCQG